MHGAAASGARPASVKLGAQSRRFWRPAAGTTSRRRPRQRATGLCRGASGSAPGQSQAGSPAVARPSASYRDAGDPLPASARREQLPVGSFAQPAPLELQPLRVDRVDQRIAFAQNALAQERPLQGFERAGRRGTGSSRSRRLRGRGRPRRPGHLRRPLHQRKALLRRRLGRAERERPQRFAQPHRRKAGRRDRGRRPRRLARDVVAARGPKVPLGGRSPKRPRSLGNEGRCGGDPPRRESSTRACEGLTPRCESDPTRRESSTRACEGLTRRCESDPRRRESFTRACEGLTRRCENDPRRRESFTRACEGFTARCENDPRRCESFTRACEGLTPRCENDPRRRESFTRACEGFTRRCVSDPRRCESFTRACEGFTARHRRGAV